MHFPAAQFSPHFADVRHALYMGWVLAQGALYGLNFAPVYDDAGNYTDRLTLTLSDHEAVTFVVPPPPSDWQLVPERLTP